MKNVVRFENTKRKLDWEQEESLRTGKKLSRRRRDTRLKGREAKTVGESNDE